MKINEIRIKRTKKLRDYENLEIGFTVDLGGEPAGPAILNLNKFLEWNIELEGRTKIRAAKIAALEAIKAKNGTRTEQDNAVALEHAKWIRDFDERKADMDAVGLSL